MKTFLIDDDYVCNYLTEILLTDEGFTTDICSFLSAEDALGLIKRNFPENVPDIIFLDLNMPLLSGWEFLDALLLYEEQIKEKCRIYILTSSLDQSDTERAKDYSLVCGFIHKPLDSYDIEVIASEINGKN